MAAPSVRRQADGRLQPKLALALGRPDMNVRRFLPLVRVEVEPIPPDAQDRRHGCRLAGGASASIFFCPTSRVSDPPERQRRRVLLDAVVRCYFHVHEGESL